MTLLPVRRLFIERALQPEMLTFVSAEEIVELFKVSASLASHFHRQLI
jgi:hypothetical protein